MPASPRLVRSPLAAGCVLLAAACGAGAPDGGATSGPGGAGAGAADGQGRITVSAAPLTSAGLGEVCYGLEVRDAADGALTWSATGLCASRYGSAERGSLAYVGPCDASSGAARVRLTVESVTDADGTALDARTSCPPEAPWEREVACVENTDTAVRFDVSVFGPGALGFVDVGVGLASLRCGARLDCADEAGAPLAVLTPPDGGGRVSSAVFSIACTAPPGPALGLAFTDLQVHCPTALEPAGPPPGATFADATIALGGASGELGADAGGLTRQNALFTARSTHGATQAQSLALTVSTALAVPPAGGGCELTLRAAPFLGPPTLDPVSGDVVTPPGAVVLELAAFASPTGAPAGFTTALPTCTRGALDAPGSGARSRVAAGGETFTHRAVVPADGGETP